MQVLQPADTFVPHGFEQLLLPDHSAGPSALESRFLSDVRSHATPCLQRSILDGIIRIATLDAEGCARRMAQEEGLLVRRLSYLPSFVPVQYFVFASYANCNGHLTMLGSVATLPGCCSLHAATQPCMPWQRWHHTDDCYATGRSLWLRWEPQLVCRGIALIVMIAH